MKRTSRQKVWLAAFVCGGVPLITIATCDPYFGVLDIYRDDDFGHFDEFYYEEFTFYDDYDCFLGCW